MFTSRRLKILILVLLLLNSRSLLFVPEFSWSAFASELRWSVLETFTVGTNEQFLSATFVSACCCSVQGNAEIGVAGFVPR